MVWRKIANWIFCRIIVNLISYYHDNYGDHGYNEPIYQNLFAKQLRNCNIEDSFNPIGGAASYSLLYHVVLSLAYFKTAEVLELGAGQSTLLISACKGKIFDGPILTIEQDKNWAEIVSRRVQHPVKHIPIVSAKVGLANTIVYDELKLHLGRRKFNIIIVDGPTGSRKFSRYSILDCIENLSDDRFIILFDDTHRAGEKQTLRLLLAILKKRLGNIAIYTVRSSKHQTIIMHGIGIDELYFR